VRIGQKAGVIQYARGKITVLNRFALEERCCECYGVVKAETDRLLPFFAKAAGLAAHPPRTVVSSHPDTGREHRLHNLRPKSRKKEIG
jgi:hypothetical protein